MKRARAGRREGGGKEAGRREEGGEGYGIVCSLHWEQGNVCVCMKRGGLGGVKERQEGCGVGRGGVGGREGGASILEVLYG